MTRPDRPPPPDDPWDADLSVIRSSVDDLGAWLAIWTARTEPDAHARRCASSSVDAIDAALAGLHRIRARLISETRQADDATAIRVDALLARIREGPPGRDAEAAPDLSREPPPENPISRPAVKSSRPSITGGAHIGGEPR